MNTITWIFLGIMAAIGVLCGLVVMFAGRNRTEAEQALDDEEQIREITNWTLEQERKREEKKHD